MLSKKSINGSDTKERILSESIRLFAINGFGAVSMRDIAEASGIRPGSIYNHYDGKESLLRAALLRFESEYIARFKWIGSVVSKTTSPEEAIRAVFEELKRTEDFSINFGMALLLKEQFHSDLIREQAYKLFYTDGIGHIQGYFDDLVKRGVISRCESRILAMVIMCCVLIGSELRLHEVLKHETPLSRAQMYDSLCEFVTDVVKLGA